MRWLQQKWAACSCHTVSHSGHRVRTRRGWYMTQSVAEWVLLLADCWQGLVCNARLTHLPACYTPGGFAGCIAFTPPRAPCARRPACAVCLCRHWLWLAPSWVVLQSSVFEVMAQRLSVSFLVSMFAGLGHLIGIDTHDVGGYGEGFPPRIQVSSAEGVMAGNPGKPASFASRASAKLAITR